MGVLSLEETEAEREARKVLEICFLTGHKRQGTQEPRVSVSPFAIC